MVEPSKSSKHAHFDEDELNDYDKTRGLKQKIDEPKTPYNDDEPEELADHEMTNEQEENDVEVEHHLEEARINREKNANLIEAALQQVSSQNDSNKSASGSVNIGDLLGKLQETKDKSEAVDQSKCGQCNPFRKSSIQEQNEKSLQGRI